MEPLTLALMAGGSFLSAAGNIIGGISAKNEAKLNAFNMEIERTQNETFAMQQAEARRDEYDAATQANIAMFSASGRDIGSDRSIEAFLKKQKETVGKDLVRMANQSASQSSASRQGASSVRTAGRNALVGSLFSAAGSTATGLSQYNQSKTGGQSSSPKQVRPKARPSK